MTDKTETKKTKVNLEIDKIQLFGEKNSLVIKKEKLRTKIVILYTAGLLNILIYSYQNPFLKPIQNKLKAKRLPFFDGLKKNLQKFLTKIRYYQRFY